MIERERGSEDLLVAGPGTEPGLQLADKVQVDMPLVDDQAVQLDHADLSRREVKRVMKQRVFAQLLEERLEMGRERADHGMIGATRLFFFQRSDVFVGLLPLFRQGARIFGIAIGLAVIHQPLHQMEKILERGAAFQIDVLLHRQLICLRGRQALDFKRYGRFVHIYHHDQNSTRR